MYPFRPDGHDFFMSGSPGWRIVVRHDIGCSVKCRGIYVRCVRGFPIGIPVAGKRGRSSQMKEQFQLQMKSNSEDLTREFAYRKVLDQQGFRRNFLRSTGNLVEKV